MPLRAPIAAISPPLIAFLSQRAFLGGDATGEVRASNRSAAQFHGYFVSITRTFDNA